MKNGNSLKISNYSFFIPKEDGTYLAYNSLTGVIISIHSEGNLLKLKNVMNEDELVYDSEDEMIEFFYDKGILVELDKDEYEYVKYCYERDIVRDSTLVLTLIVTRQCNLRCIYCYEEHLDKPMTEDVYNSLLQFIESVLRSKRYSNIAISLFGGEPFLEYNRVIRFLEAAKVVCDEYEADFNVSATTNGALIFPERFEAMYAVNCRYYQITIDGFEETHDKYRASRDKKGSWNKIISNLKYMASTDYDFNVTIRTNFNEEVFERAEEFYQFVKENFDKRFQVYYEGIKRLGGENDGDLDIVEGEAISNTTVNIAKVISNLGLKNDVVDMMTRPFSRICYATKHNNYLIDYDGSILKCTLSLEDDLNHIGNVTEEGVFDIDEVKHAKWVGKKTELREECKNCKVLPVCYGGRCVNGQMKGGVYWCDPQMEEKELLELIAHYN